MDAFLHELPQGLDMMTLDPSRYGLFNGFSRDRAFEIREDGKKVKDDVGVLWRTRGVEGHLKFKASAIRSWLEHWRLILVIVLEQRAFRLQRRLDMRTVSTILSSTVQRLLNGDGDKLFLVTASD